MRVGESLCSGVCVDEQTDQSNCGGCGLACSVPCASGRCVEPLVTGGVYAVAVDSVNVYWTTSDTFNMPGSALMSMPKGGGTPVTLYSGAGGAGVAVDATSVYGTDGKDEAVMKVPVGGGAAVTLASGQTAPFGIALDAANVYWTAGTVDGTVMSVPLGGGTPFTLAVGQSNPQGITVDATSVYWADYRTPAKNFSDGAVMAVPIGGGGPTTLATGAYACCVAVNATDLFWNWGEIVKLPLHGGGLTTTLSTVGGTALAIDDTRAYWYAGPGVSTPAMKGPVSLPLEGGTPTLLATNLGQPVLSLAVDATRVYVAALTGGVFKVTPK